MEYITEAIKNEKSGEKIELKKTSDYQLPTELMEKFHADPDNKNTFNRLTPGRQRSYLLHFSGAKQPKTRRSRIDKAIEKIYQGKGYNEDDEQ
ncbi:MAG: YdeI/OmpD-associated family protein [Bacteroidota bacterium]